MKDTYGRVSWVPDQIAFDTNCGLRRHTDAQQDAFFDNIGLTVDAFHFNSKHKVTDVFCQEKCNPALFAELKTPNGWFFNTSIAEQTNVWLGKYQSILREMRVDRFNFFLDEMIMRRNRNVIQKLASEGYHPSSWEAGDIGPR